VEAEATGAGKQATSRQSPHSASDSVQLVCVCERGKSSETFSDVFTRRYQQPLRLFVPNEFPFPFAIQAKGEVIKLSGGLCQHLRIGSNQLIGVSSRSFLKEEHAGCPSFECEFDFFTYACDINLYRTMVTHGGKIEFPNSCV